MTTTQFHNVSIHALVISGPRSVTIKGLAAHRDVLMKAEEFVAPNATKAFRTKTVKGRLL